MGRRGCRGLVARARIFMGLFEGVWGEVVDWWRVRRMARLGRRMEG